MTRTMKNTMKAVLVAGALAIVPFATVATASADVVGVHVGPLRAGVHVGPHHHYYHHHACRGWGYHRRCW